LTPGRFVRGGGRGKKKKKGKGGKRKEKKKKKTLQTSCSASHPMKKKRDHPLFYNYSILRAEGGGGEKEKVRGEEGRKENGTISLCSLFFSLGKKKEGTAKEEERFQSPLL